MVDRKMAGEKGGDLAEASRYFDRPTFDAVRDLRHAVTLGVDGHRSDLGFPKRCQLHSDHRELDVISDRQFCQVNICDARDYHNMPKSHTGYALHSRS
jgi:hypothetical protein